MRVRCRRVLRRRLSARRLCPVGLVVLPCRPSCLLWAAVAGCDRCAPQARPCLLCPSASVWAAVGRLSRWLRTAARCDALCVLLLRAAPRRLCTVSFTWRPARPEGRGQPAASAAAASNDIARCAHRVGCSRASDPRPASTETLSSRVSHGRWLRTAARPDCGPASCASPSDVSYPSELAAELRYVRPLAVVCELHRASCVAARTDCGATSVHPLTVDL